MSKIFSRKNCRPFSLSATLSMALLIAASGGLALSILLLLFGKVHAAFVTMIVAIPSGLAGCAPDAYRIACRNYEAHAAKMREQGRDYEG